MELELETVVAQMWKRLSDGGLAGLCAQLIDLRLDPALDGGPRGDGGGHADAGRLVAHLLLLPGSQGHHAAGGLDALLGGTRGSRFFTKACPGSILQAAISAYNQLRVRAARRGPVTRTLLLATLTTFMAATAGLALARSPGLGTRLANRPGLNLNDRIGIPARPAEPDSRAESRLLGYVI